MNAQRRSELRTMLEQLDNCLFEVSRHAAEAVEWAQRASAYRKQAKSLALSCDHCRADNATHLCSGGEWWCDTCLANCCDM